VACEAGRFFGRLAAAVEAAPTFADLLEDALVFAHRAVEEHEVLQKMLQTEPDLITTQLTVEGARLLRLVEGFLQPHLERERLRAGLVVDQAAEYLARLVLSYINSAGSWDLTDRAHVRHLVRTELLAGVLACDL
jgi:hypothetical protein